MKIPAASHPVVLVALTLLPLLGAAACTRDGLAGNPSSRKQIPLAPISAASPGIGAPGAGSMDTRGTGTIATGQGDTPLEEAGPGSVPISGAGNVPGARKGGRL